MVSGRREDFGSAGRRRSMVKSVRVLAKEGLYPQLSGLKMFVEEEKERGGTEDRWGLCRAARKTWKL